MRPTPESRRAHRWLDKRYPKQNRCEECGFEGDTHYAFRWHPELHSQNRGDYLELCAMCHVRMDTETLPRATKECELCGTEFVAHRPMALYCSDACRQKAWRRRQSITPKGEANA